MRGVDKSSQTAHRLLRGRIPHDARSKLDILPAPASRSASTAVENLWKSGGACNDRALELHPQADRGKLDPKELKTWFGPTRQLAVRRVGRRRRADGSRSRRGFSRTGSSRGTERCWRARPRPPDSRVSRSASSLERGEPAVAATRRDRPPPPRRIGARPLRQPAIHLRQLRRRLLQPVRPRRGARRRRVAVALVQPALPLRRRRSGKDPPDARDRAGGPARATPTRACCTCRPSAS